MADYDIRKFEYFRDRDLSYSFDSLTGVLTREEVSEYARHLIRRGTPFTFIIADIDNFKLVNDSFGHIAGDEVLVRTAEYICGKVGPSGVVGRFGGDEFMIVLEGVSDYSRVWDFGHDVNKNIGSLTFGSVKGLAITLTMGMTRYPADGATYDMLLGIADKALYRGKMKGRNCFIIYLPEKHRGMELSESGEKKYTSTYLCSSVFRYLTSDERIEYGIDLLFRQFSSYFMVDHICIESPAGMNFEVIHRLSKNKSFSHMDCAALEKYFNGVGLMCISKVEEMRTACDALAEMWSQHIRSAMYCKISAFGCEYGCVRVDMTDTVRIWQPAEKEVMIVMANAIGVLMHYQGKSFADMPVRAPVIMGGEN